MLATAILVAGVFSSLLIGWFVLSRDVSKRINQLYGLLTLSFIALTVFNHLTLSPTPGLLWYIRFVILSTTIASAALFLLIVEIRRGDKKRKPDQLYTILALSTVFVCFLDLTPYVFSGLTTSDSPTPVPAWGVGFFVMHFIFGITGAVAILIDGVRRGNQKEKRRYRTILMGVVPILVLAPLTGVILPVFFQNTSLILFSPLYLVVFLGAVGYAIVRHGLFDVRAAVIRTTAYILSLASLSFIYFLLAYFASKTLFQHSTTTGFSTSPVNIALALLLAFIFQPVKQFFDKTTDKIFYRDRYNTADFIERLSELLTSTTELRSLLQRAATEIGATLKAEQAFLYVRYNHTHRVVGGTSGHSNLSEENVEQIIDYSTKTKQDVLVTEFIEASDLRHVLEGLHIAIAMPLKRDGHAVGVLALGAQRTNRYTTRDVRVLSAIADELVIAIQNSLSIQEVRDINAHLEEHIREATTKLRHSNSKLKELDKSKDEFISMASHQLRTPLTSIKGYLSMVLEGDVGKISTSQRKVLEEAYTSSQRMVYLISDFLNVSRLQTGKFELELSPTNLATVLTEEIAQLQVMAQSRQLTIDYTPPSNFPTVVVDEDKFRQVMMNLIDNAIYYSRANTPIEVTLAKDANDLIFKVTDHGIGVPASERHKLFTKFYRASNAKKQRPDGTGIGLFMAQKVIVAHGGSTIFESKENVGSTFGFRLPVDAVAKK